MKVTINQLRRIIKEEVSRMLVEEHSEVDPNNLGDFTTEMQKVIARDNPDINAGTLSTIFYTAFADLVDKYPDNEQLLTIEEEIQDALDNVPLDEAEEERIARQIISGLEEKVRNALGFEGPVGDLPTLPPYLQSLLRTYGLDSATEEIVKELPNEYKKEFVKNLKDLYSEEGRWNWDEPLEYISNLWRNNPGITRTLKNKIQSFDRELGYIYDDVIEAEEYQDDF